MIITGFDLSLSDTGWAVLEITSKTDYKILKSGHIPTELRKGGRTYTTGSRLHKISELIKGILEKYPPDYIAKEASFSNGNNKSTQQIYKVNGAFELLIHQSAIRTFTEFAPSTIKKTITGNGHSKKIDVAKRVAELTNIKTKNDNVTDAVAVALTYAIKNNLITIPGESA